MKAEFLRGEEYTTIRMAEGRPFRILQLTDIHLGGGWLSRKKDKLALDAVEKVVRAANADFIVVTGDMVYPMFMFSGTSNNLKATRKFADKMESLGVPWTCVFGNHDDEGRADKYRLAEIYSEADNCLFSNGPYNIGGVGNYAVNIVKDGAPVYSIIMMDSGTYLDYPEFSYGTFTPAQVSWYEWLQKGLTAAGYARSMMFYHIPVPEFAEAYAEWEAAGFPADKGVGEKREDVCCSAVNTGMFRKALELGATTHMFAGHDHVNNYSIDHNGIVLTYGVKSSTQYYHDEDMLG